MKEYRELIELVGVLCNDQLSEIQAERLESILDGDPEAQEVYRNYMALHAELFFQQGYASSSKEDNSNEVIPKPKTFGMLRRIGWPLATAACLLIGTLLGGYLANPEFGLDSWQLGQQPEFIPVSSPVAKVTGSRNCRWANSPTEFGFGSQLFEGQRLQLQEGLVEVTFSSGARVILEAPADFVVATEDQSVLNEGRLTASIPDGSEGFQVAVPGLRLVDHGTEFGVLVDRAGNAEVHVFDGMLEGQFLTEAGTVDRTLVWNPDSAVRIDPHHNHVRELVTRNVQFVRSLSPPFGPSNGLLVREDFNYPEAPLADQNGGFGWGGAWEDISTDSNPARINRVANESLKFNGLSNSGNRATLEGNFNRIRRVLSTSFGGVFDTAGLVEEQDGARLIGKDGSTIYLSFTQQISKENEVFYGFELHRGDGNRNRVLCLGHGAAQKWTTGNPRQPVKEAGVTGWSVTSEFNERRPNRLTHFGDLGPETTEVVFVVAKIQFNENNEDEIKVFVNPVSLDNEEDCEAVVTGTGNFSFDRVSLANFEGSKSYSVDHIRIGTNFRAVTRHQWDSNAVAKFVRKIPSGN